MSSPLPKKRRAGDEAEAARAKQPRRDAEGAVAVRRRGSLPPLDPVGWEVTDDDDGPWPHLLVFGKHLKELRDGRVQRMRRGADRALFGGYTRVEGDACEAHLLFAGPKGTHEAVIDKHALEDLDFPHAVISEAAFREGEWVFGVGDEERVKVAF